MNSKMVALYALAAGTALVLLAVITAGCLTTERVQSSPPPVLITQGVYTQTVWTDHAYGFRISKIVIPKDNVTCYALDIAEGGGISCLRDEVCVWRQ